nr:DUF433 domain-containing protein [Salinibacter ruber]
MGSPELPTTESGFRTSWCWHERLGWSVDQIASEYDLSLADVYAALAYYFAHREEIDRSLEESRAFIVASAAVRHTPVE